MLCEGNGTVKQGRRIKIKRKRDEKTANRNSQNEPNLPIKSRSSNGCGGFSSSIGLLTGIVCKISFLFFNLTDEEVCFIVEIFCCVELVRRRSSSTSCYVGLGYLFFLHKDPF